jgi:peptide/nickel transport system permease protein
MSASSQALGRPRVTNQFRAGSFKRWFSRPARLARKYPLGAFSALILAAMVMMAVFAPVVAPNDPLQQNLANHQMPPSLANPLGTDAFGRDVWSRIVYGSRVSLYVGFLSVLPAMAVGAMLGVGSAYLGGYVDLSLQRVVDTFLGFPPLVMSMVIVIGLGASLEHLTLAIGLLLIPGAIRLSRSAALSVIQEPYVEAARGVGATWWRVIVVHVLPNSIAPVFVAATAALATAILAEAALSFLGLGVPPPAPSWGSMLAESVQQGRLRAAPWLGIFPGVALTLAVFSFALLGDALRDILDPRLRQR